ncbi:Glycosyl transferase family 2 [Chryseobacterium sp. MOF25P]|uniref:glycosyltransferase family 2 protein n=1 Tax=unclassified Chryseobacterium TaxID=2593645 RepID=UPI000806070C|nr:MULTISPECIES: glycosyltransferase [unclassified Chryseobacterium]OBW39875.1 Glycosyl transferase family 2 [Chryseobacterium sp. MOF25P]OBW44797.1 Glycosyl transferase family 2 [Chryseobacterium sp. BGARF1]
MNKLAFVIPYYKIDFFEETLKSLEEQTNKNFTVYVGNDNSPNDPFNIIEKYSSLNITYKVFETNLGAIDLEGQWIRCIDLSKDEEWICILGDDDCPKKNFVEEFYKILPVVDEKNINVIKTAITSIDSNSKLRGADLVHPEYDTSINTFWRDRNKQTHTSISENIFRRSSYEKIGFRGFPLAWGTPLVAWIDYSEGGLIYGLNSTQMSVRSSEINLSRVDSFKDQKQVGEAMVYEVIFSDYHDKFSDSQRLFLIKKYHAVLHYYQLKNKLPSSIFTLYCKYGGIQGPFFYILRELKWKFTK